MSTRRMAAAALLISVFVAGAASGFAVFQLLDRSSSAPPWPGGPPGRLPGMMRPPMTPLDSGGPFRGFAPMMLSLQLSEALGLSQEQRDRIEQIMERHRAESSRVLEELGPRLRNALDSMQVEIRGVLTEEQQARFDQFLEADRDLFRRRMEERRQRPRLP